MHYSGLTKRKKCWCVVFVMTILLMVGLNDAKMNVSYLADWCDEGSGYRLPVEGNPVVKLNIDTLDSFPAISENYIIPYVGKNLKIAGNVYSTYKIIRKIDNVRADIMRSLHVQAKPGIKLRVDMRGVKAVVDSLKKTDIPFSAINLKMKKNYYLGKPIETIDLFKYDKEYFLWDPEDSLKIEFILKTDRQNVSFETIKAKSQITATFGADFVFAKEKDGYSLGAKFDSFTMDVSGITRENTISLPGPYFVEEGNLKIFITKKEMKTNIRDESLWMDVELDKLKDVQIPVFGQLAFSSGKKPLSLEKIVERIRKLNVYTQHVLDYGIDLDKDGNEGTLDLNTVKKNLARFSRKISPVGHIAILNESLKYMFDKYDESNFYDMQNSKKLSKINKAKLHNQSNTLVYKITLDSIGFANNVDSSLINGKGFNASIDAYIKLAFSIANGFIIMESCDVEKIDLRILSDVKELNLPPLKAVFYDGFSKKYGKFRYSVRINLEPASWYDSVKIQNPGMVVDYDALSLKYGSLPLDGKFWKDQFVYDFEKGNWIIPGSLKSNIFFSDELLNQTYSVINALRNLRESVKNELNGFSAETVKNVSSFEEKLEQVFYGDGTEKCQYGLFEHNFVKLPNEWRKRIVYKKRYSNLFDFVKKYNEAWKIVFKGDSLEKSCEFKYLDVKKNEITDETASKVAYVKLVFNFGANIDPVLVKKLDEQLAEISPNGKVRVDANGNVLLELTMALKR